MTSKRRWVGPHDEPLGMWQFHGVLPYEEHIRLVVPGKENGGRRIHGRPIRGLAEPLRLYQDWVYTPGPLLALAVLLAAAGAVWARRRRLPQSLGFEGVVLSLAGLGTLLIPAMSAMFD
jgi:hypothetical protein